MQPSWHADCFTLECGDAFVPTGPANPGMIERGTLMVRKCKSEATTPVEILKRSKAFDAILKGPLYSDQATKAFKEMAEDNKKGFVDYSDGYTASGSFGSSVNLEYKSEIIKTDPDAIFKILRGGNRPTAKKIKKHAKHFYTRSPGNHVPDVDSKVMAKYAKKKHHKTPAADRPGPNLQFVCNSPYGAFPGPRLLYNFPNAVKAQLALKNKEISASTLVSFPLSSGWPIQTLASGIKAFLGVRKSA